jgi:hypothetical protein
MATATTTKKKPARKTTAKKTGAKKAAAKKPVKKTTGKKTTARKKKVEAAKTNNRADRSTAAGKNVFERRTDLVKLLTKLKAFNADTSVSIAVLAEKLEYTHHDVYCLSFHQYPLAQEGIVSAIKIPGETGLFVHLTKSGRRPNYKEFPFARKTT